MVVLLRFGKEMRRLPYSTSLKTLRSDNAKYAETNILSLLHIRVKRVLQKANDNNMFNICSTTSQIIKSDNRFVSTLFCQYLTKEKCGSQKD